MDFSKFGLSEKMRKFSCLSNRGTHVSALEFDSQTESGAVDSIHLRDASINNAKLGTAVIGTANIGTLSFNESQGGTLVLGGTTNGNGVLELQDEAGGTQVTMDNTGITINNGSLTIKNSSGSNVIDSLGVVSSAAFTKNETTADALNQSITSTDVTDLTDANLNIVLNRESQVLGMYRVSLYTVESGTNNCDGRVNFAVNGTTATAASIFLNGGNGGNVDLASHTCYHFFTADAGTTPIKLTAQLTREQGSGTMVVYNYKLSYLVLGN